MKKVFSILFALMMGVNMWAAVTATTFTYADFSGQGTEKSGGSVSATKNQITVSSTKGYGASSNTRVYSNGIITIEAAQVISKIEVTCTASSTSDYGPGKMSTTTANSKYTYSGKVGTWSPVDDAEITTVYLACSAQVRFTELKVYTGTEDVTVNSLILDLDTLRLEEGEQQTLVATVDPEDVKLKWKSSNEEVATVDKTGLVKTNIPGEAVITVSAGDKKDSCIVLVSGSGEFVWYNILTADNMQYLKNGDKVMIAASSGSALMGQWESGTSIAPITQGLNFSEDKSKCKEVKSAVYTLIKDGEKWNLKDVSGKYLSINALKDISAISNVASSAKLTFSFQSSSLKIQSNTSYGYLQYNSSASIYTTYTSYQGNVSLYFRHDDYAGELNWSPDTVAFSAKHLKGGEAMDTTEVDIQFKNLTDAGVLLDIQNVSSNAIGFNLVGGISSITEPGKIKIAYRATQAGDYTAELYMLAEAKDGQTWEVSVPVTTRILDEETILTPISIAQAYDSLTKEVGNWGNSTTASGKKEYLLNDVTVTGHAGNFLFVKDATGSLCIFDDQNRTHAAGSFYQNGDVISGLRGTMKVATNAVEMMPSEGYMPTMKTGTAILPDTITNVLDVTREGRNVNRYVVAKGVTFAEIKTLEKYYDEVNFDLGGSSSVLKNYMVKNLGAVDKQKDHYDVEGFVWASGKQMQLIANIIKVSPAFVQHVSEVTLSAKSATLNVSEQLKLTATIIPADAANKNVTWSAKHGLVSVSEGLVTALEAGQDTVVVTTEDGGFSAECAITISAGTGFHPGAVIYEKVTKAADLQAGNKYLILFEEGSVAAGEWQINKNNTKGKYAAAEAVIIGSQATAPEAMVFTLGGTTGAWTLQDSVGYLRITGSSENGLLLRNGTTANTWTISATGNAIISNDYNTRSIRFNNAKLSGGGQIFTSYTNTDQCSIQLYRQTEQIVPSDVKATGIVFTEKNITIRVAEEKQLIAMVQPHNASVEEKEIIWSVKDAAEGISVKEGLIVATEKGQYDIIATLAKHADLADTCHVTVMDSVHVTGISLDKKEASLVELSSLQLKATIAPKNADNQTVIWETSDTSVATVDENGLVTAIRFGEAIITARSDEFPSLSDTCNLTVTALAGDRYHLMTKDSVLEDGDLIVFYNATKGTASAGLVESKKYLEGQSAAKAGTDLIIEESQPMLLKKNGSYWNLSINGSPIGHNQTSDNSVDFNGKYSDFTIAINDDAMATVKSQTSANPQFYCNNSGDFRLYNSTSMAPVQIFRKVTAPDVPIAVESVELDYNTLYLRADEQDQLEAFIYPKDAKIQDVEWGSMDENIATVENGLVTAIAKGETKVWVRTVDGGFTDTCLVTVYASLNLPDVTWNRLQSLDSLKEGTRVFFASVKQNENYVMGIYDYDVAKANIRGAEATFSEDRHQVTASESYAYTVSIENGKYIFRDLDGSYLCDYNQKNLSAQDILDNKARWTAAMTEDFEFNFTNVYNTGYVIYNNHNSDMFCSYNSFDKSNMARIAIFSDNAPEWVEPVRIPELTITYTPYGSSKPDTITDKLSWGDVVYEEYGTEYDHYQESKTLTFKAKNLNDAISLSLYKGTVFTLLRSEVSQTGGTASVNFSTNTPGSYTDTLYVRCGELNYTIALSATAVSVVETLPSVSLSTSVVNLNIVLTDSMRATASMTFSTKNLAKNLYIKWEKGEVPSHEGENVYIIAGNEARSIDFGSATIMDTVTRTDELILFEATAYTEGTYVSTLVFYSFKEGSKEETVFEERVVVTVRVYSEAPEPSINAILIGREVITDQIDWGTVEEKEPYQVAPYESEKKVTVVAGYLTDSIRLSLSKGTAFQLTPATLGTQGGQTKILFHATKAGNYTDTLHVVSGSITRTITLSAKAVSDITKPELTLSTQSVQMQINTQSSQEADAQITFSVANLKKPLYIKWEKGTIPAQENEEMTILAGAEQNPITYGSSLDMGTDNRKKEKVNVHVNASVEGTYTSTLCFYSPDEDDPSNNVFEQRVIIKVRVMASTDLSTMDANQKNMKKLIIDNQLFIYHNGLWYNTLGQMVHGKWSNSK